MSTASLKCIFASLPRTTRGNHIQLGGDPKGKNFLYCNGNNVYIRDIEDATKCEVFSDHKCAATVARYSPSGFYIASGDTSGKILTWDTVNPEHLVKNEFPVLGGSIKDLDWSGDSTKLVIGGEGREKFAVCITADSGNTVGSISGCSKCINSVAFKSTRPFRIATASEDRVSYFYEGPPFKLTAQQKEHMTMVNCVKYHPKGEVFITGGSGGKAFVYDGKTAEPKGQLGGEAGAHKGGIYGMCFNASGSEILTVSGDKTAKIWDVATQELKVEFVMGTEISDQQVGCLWQGDNIVTVSLSGYINYLDPSNPSVPRKILKGHNKPITTMVVSPDKSRVYSACSTGKVLRWDPTTGLSEELQGSGHTNQVNDMVIDGDSVVSVGMDDTARFYSLSGNAYGNSVKLPSQPKSVAALEGCAVVVCIEHVVVLDGSNIVFQQQVGFEPTSVDIHPSKTVVAVGSVKDRSVHIFELESSTLKGVKKIPVDDDVTDVKFSPDGAYLAVSTGSKKYVALFTYENYEEVYKFKKHTAKVFNLSWSPNSDHFVSCGLDGKIIVWTLEKTYSTCSTLELGSAHQKADVRKVDWLSDNCIISCSSDSTLRQWDIKFAN